jgi:hypothetical protein
MPREAVPTTGWGLAWQDGERTKDKAALQQTGIAMNSDKRMGGMTWLRKLRNRG